MNDNLLVIRVLATFLISIIFSAGLVNAQETVTGLVFHDLNQNGEHDMGERGLRDVLVSNGTDIVTTDEGGHYEINADDNSILFIIKPRDWTTELDENNIPRFYTILSSDGAGGTDYAGLEATGPRPESIDFALYPQEESDTFRVVAFGDTQSRDLDEIGYIAHDSVQELIGVDAAFGFTLGDLVFDDLDLFQPLNEVIGQIGIPWRHVLGNHDIDFSADTNWDARGAYVRTYGPPWYAFTWGGAHFVTVDNIRWFAEGDERYYRTGLGEEQLEFIRNFLDLVPDDELVIFLMHIPWVDSTPWADETERARVFEVLASHPHTVSFAAHTHRHYHQFIDSEYGWPGEQSHHLVSMGAVCGAWWTGAHDEYGIPHSMMRDGSPTGYAFLDINGNDWKLQFKAARRPHDLQMHIFSPDEIPVTAIDTVEIFANVFNALPDADVLMRVGKSGTWQSMIREEKMDPVYEAMRKRDHALNDISWRRTGDANPTPRHLWQGILPEGLEPGTYTVFVRSEDEWGTYEGRRIIRITQ